VSIVGRKTRGGKALRFPDDLDGARMILPGRGSELRTAFDAQIERANIRIDVVAEVDDMALLRLLARESGVLALVPPVVVRDELASGRLVERCRIPRLKENFYAITLHRRFPNPLIKSLVAAAAPLGG
jgi:LysR family transcriptional regulator, transcriptional activator of nhaA